MDVENLKGAVVLDPLRKESRAWTWDGQAISNLQFN